jgi:hypothetical protein
MKVMKRISVLVPSELLYLFDPDYEHLFVVKRERGRIVARPAEEYYASEDCTQFSNECYGDCSSCTCYDDGFDNCKLFSKMG